MDETDNEKQARGCFYLIVMVMLAFGIGGLFGWPIGCIAFAAMMIIQHMRGEARKKHDQID